MMMPAARQRLGASFSAPQPPPDVSAGQDASDGLDSAPLQHYSLFALICGRWFS